jgi:hypothetical protein
MYPPARNYYPVPDFGPDIPEQLQRALASTIDAFNARNYTATAVSGRRTLEGIFKYLVLPENANVVLAQLIERAKDKVDFAEPITNLAHAIRSGGNLGAHFDSEKEPDQAIARHMVELLEYLISYLYVLPRKIKQLKEALGQGSPRE